MTACIVGWAHSKFGKLTDDTLEGLIVQVAREALDHAGIGPDDVDEIVLGHFNAGFSPQDFTASLVLQADDRLRFKPATRGGKTPAQPALPPCGRAPVPSLRATPASCLW